jgi:hypothetical protein
MNMDITRDLKKICSVIAETIEEEKRPELYEVILSSFEDCTYDLSELIAVADPLLDDVLRDLEPEVFAELAYEQDEDTEDDGDLLTEVDVFAPNDEWGSFDE